VVKLARATSGSIIPSIAEMHRMEIEEPRTNSVAMRVSSPGAAVVLAVEVASAERVELGVPAVQVALGEPAA
jgi:hypothetical protein